MTLNAIAEELAEEQPGSNLVIAKLADLLFMVSPRVSGYGPSQFHRLDARHHGPSCGRAISCMHAAPERRWTLQAEGSRLFESRRAAIQRSGRPGLLAIDRVAHARRRRSAARWNRQH